MTRRAAQIRARLRLATAHERALEADVANWIARVGRIAAAHIRAGQPSKAADAPFEVGARLETTLRARLAATARASAQLLADEFKASGVRLETKGLIDDMLAAATRWVRSYAAAKVTQISESLRRVLRRTIDRAQAEATPPAQLAKEIVATTGGDIGRRRAIRIARTETGIAAEKGAFEGADATGLELEKEWGGTMDNRIRPAHKFADVLYGPKGRIPFDRPFVVDDEPLMHCKDPSGSPGNIINCRCQTLIYPRIPR
jgi:uncharacterized protein with gpF-like domain